MILSDATLRQIACDAKVDPKQFKRYVNDFGYSIVVAVNVCREVEKVTREHRRDRQQPAKAKVRTRRQQAAERYANEAWKYDVR